jgi:diguanylate cyclase (GGDEF)-like protein
LLFRAFPEHFAGSSVGSGTHALTWVLAVAICEIVGGRGHHFMIVGAIKLTDPSVRIRDLELNREALQADFAEFDLSVLITVVIAVNPVLAVAAVPTVLLARRFIMHAQLLAASRIDTKTGLLNAATWEREAEVEVTRAVRMHIPLAVALVDIDHFKVVNDTYGHLAGDKALRAVTDALRSQLRGSDMAGRFGGEEFALLLPQAREQDALNVAERLRAHIASLSIPVDDDDETGPRIRLTISVGVASVDGGESRELTDLLAAADSALYHAKETGRNKTHVVSAGLRALLPAPRLPPA